MKDVLSSYNPGNGELVGQVEITPIDNLPQIVASARQAGKTWAKIPIRERIERLIKIASLLKDRSEDLGMLLSREMGKDIQRGIREVMGCVYTTGEKSKLMAEALKPKVMENQASTSRIEWVPFGVVGVITPWNYPISMAAWMLTPALVAGNAVILKPSEETPLVAQAFVDIFNTMLPKNVLQIIHGDETQGKALVDSDVNMIAFTGSKAAGQHIIKSAAKSVKRLVMELGGKDPLIVMEDADIEKAAQFAVSNSFENTGQMCISTERVFVDEKIADIFEEKVGEIASHYKAGQWNDPKANIGPIINDSQRQIILDHIEDALNKGAKAILGGRDNPDRFVLPTVLSGVKENMKIAREETFGPVVCLTRFQTIDEAISLANQTEYGLGAVVFGKKNVEAVADQLEAGMIGINRSVVGEGDNPWAGAKQSGLGFHGSPDGHRQFAQIRVTSF